MQVVSSGLKLEKGPAHHKSTTGFLSPGPPDGPWPGLCETLCLQCGIVAQNYTAGAKTPKTDCQPHPWSQIQVPPFSHCSSDLAGGCSVCRAPLGSLGLGPALSPGLGGLESTWAGVGTTEGSHVVAMLALCSVPSARSAGMAALPAVSRAWPDLSAPARRPGQCLRHCPPVTG